MFRAFPNRFCQPLDIVSKPHLFCDTYDASVLGHHRRKEMAASAFSIVCDSIACDRAA